MREVGQFRMAGACRVVQSYRLATSLGARLSSAELEVELHHLVSRADLARSGIGASIALRVAVARPELARCLLAIDGGPAEVIGGGGRWPARPRQNGAGPELRQESPHLCLELRGCERRAKRG